MSYHYGIPPDGYKVFYDSSPASSGDNIQYVPQHYDYQYSTPSKGHRRQTSHNPSPRAGGYYTSAGSPPPTAYRQGAYYESPIREAHVSTEPRKRAYSSSKPTATYVYTTMKSSRSTPQTTRKSSRPVYVSESDDDYEDRYHARDRAPERTRSTRHTKKPSTDSQFYFGQDQIYEEQYRQKTRVRSSTTTRPSSLHQRTSSRVPVATAEDAKRYGILPGYSLKNWDPTETPITLLGSVFDANSLGKWIYDWTLYQHTGQHPITEMAGELWLLLIKLAGKMKRAKQCVLGIRRADDRDMVYSFIESGKNLWRRFEDLLHQCEKFMMKAAKKVGSKSMMGTKAGTEFVDSIFGRDRCLESTERLMHSLHTWTMRFDVNCEDLLRRPTSRGHH